jgi:hypothetical protein
VLEEAPQLRIQQRDVLAPEDLGDERAPGPQHMRRDVERLEQRGSGQLWRHVMHGGNARYRSSANVQRTSPQTAAAMATRLFANGMMQAKI